MTSNATTVQECCSSSFFETGAAITSIPWSQQVDEALTDICEKSADSVNSLYDGESKNDSITTKQMEKIEKIDKEDTSFSNDRNHIKRKTWASIASQPSKGNFKTNSSTFTNKKKGMPPPPMIPGKLNLNTCDSPQKYASSTSFFKSKDICNRSVNNPVIDRKDKINAVKPFEYNTDKCEKDHLNYLPGVSTSKNICVRPKHQPETASIIKSSSIQEISNTVDEDIGSSSFDNDPSFYKLEEKQIVKDLIIKNNYNPPEIDLEKAALARFFVIKSYSEDDIHRSIKYEIWCSTDHGNKRLDNAFRERTSQGGYVYLLFSVNGSGHFCGMAQMITSVDYNSVSNVWSQDKWRGKFKVKWVYVKDVPNASLRYIRLENNENKSVTHSRDAQEVPNLRGIQVLKILHTFKHKTSIFDDFNHYEKRQEAEVTKKDGTSHCLTQPQYKSQPTKMKSQPNSSEVSKYSNYNSNTESRKHIQNMSMPKDYNIENSKNQYYKANRVYGYKESTSEHSSPQTYKKRETCDFRNNDISQINKNRQFYIEKI